MVPLLKKIQSSNPKETPFWSPASPALAGRADSESICTSVFLASKLALAWRSLTMTLCANIVDFMR